MPINSREKEIQERKKAEKEHKKKFNDINSLLEGSYDELLPTNKSQPMIEMVDKATFFLEWLMNLQNTQPKKYYEQKHLYQELFKFSLEDRLLLLAYDSLLIGMSFEQERNYAKAQKYYEKATQFLEAGRANSSPRPNEFEDLVLIESRRDNYNSTLKSVQNMLAELSKKQKANETHLNENQASPPRRKP